MPAPTTVGGLHRSVSGAEMLISTSCILLIRQPDGLFAFFASPSLLALSAALPAFTFC
jgi:hypothetical protein